MREFVRLKRLCSPCALSPSAKLKFHPSIPFAGYGKADVDGRTRNIFEARANLTPRPHDQHPRIRASRNIRRLKRKGKKSSRSRAILIPDNWKSFPNLERAWALILFSPQKKKKAQLAHGVRNACLIPTSGVSRLIFSASSIFFSQLRPLSPLSFFLAPGFPYVSSARS